EPGRFSRGIPEPVSALRRARISARETRHSPMRRDSPDPFLFPRCLYGSAVSTRAAWRTALSQVLDAGVWEGVSRRLEMADVNDIPGEIILEDIHGLVLRRQSHWRLYWIPKLWVVQEVPISIDPRIIQRQRSIILPGMDYCWFALGMLKPDQS